ncbi:BRO family protein [Bifidobacterium cuniculi]
MRDDQDGVWFVAKDVATILGYANPQKAIRDHVDDEDRGVNETVTPGGKQKIAVINESGLYSLVLSSKLPGAREFKHWVTGDVLPSIRRDGAYVHAQPEDDDLTVLAKGMLAAQRALERKDRQIAAQAAIISRQTPLARLGDAFVNTDGTLSVTQAARHFLTLDKRMNRDTVFGILRGARMIEQKSNAPTKRAIDQGLLKQVVPTDMHGRKLSKPYARFTTKGLNWFIDRFIHGSQPTLEGI